MSTVDVGYDGQRWRCYTGPDGLVHRAVGRAYRMTRCEEPDGETSAAFAARDLIPIDPPRPVTCLGCIALRPRERHA